jgi:hypothetical protein
LSDCLISPLFPFKLLSLQAFTRRGHKITIEQDLAHISNKINDVILVGIRDPLSKLFLLQQAPIKEEQAPVKEKQLLAKSYGGQSENDLLWKLHLRHGHRNLFPKSSLPVPRV